jgi:hypothetical protein
VDTLFVWRDYALVGAPRDQAHRLHAAAALHRAAPLGVVADRALLPFAAPDVTVSIGQLDIVSDRVLDAFQPARWEASVRALADNGGTRSRYALRVRDAVLLNGHPGPDDAADIAADWIAAEFASYGYTPTEHLFPYSLFNGPERAATFGMRNIIAEHPALRGDGEGVILLVAHYDTKASRTPEWDTRWRDIRAPGADDNASGVATVLEAARLLTELRLAHTVRFVLFSGEELGLIGSRHYADAMARADEDIVAVINVDMIGHDALGRFDLHAVANGQSRWLLEAVESIRRVITSDVVLVPQVDSNLTFSDHAPFWWEGYSALLFTEETDIESGAFYEHYHTANDTADRVDYAYGTEAARLICGIVALLAAPDAPPDPTPLPRGDEEKDEVVRVLNAVAYPNPYVVGSNIPLRIAYPAGSAVDVRAEVYTAAGRRVFTVAPSPTTTSAPVVIWDGRTQDGTLAPPGLYFVRVETRDRVGSPYVATLRVLVAP